MSDYYDKMTRERKLTPEDEDKIKELLKRDSVTCPRCGMTSYNPNDIREGYCGNCHDWTGRPR